MWTNAVSIRWCIYAALEGDELTPLVLKPKFSRIIRPIPWLMMPWLLVSPGHHQPWYWLYMVDGSLSLDGFQEGFQFLSGRISMTHAISALRNARKCKYIFMCLRINSAWQGLTLTLSRLKYVKERQISICNPYYFLLMIRPRLFKCVLREDQIVPIIHNNYCDCW